jgi:hypothetical protein
LRKYAYSISALAVACFFLVPEPNLAVISALLLQTLAYIVIAGTSVADGIVLTGVTILLLGLLPVDHPLIRGQFFLGIKPWLLGTGIAVFAIGLLLVGRQILNQR